MKRKKLLLPQLIGETGFANIGMMFTKSNSTPTPSPGADPGQRGNAMKKGDKVMIYLDPITKKEREGEAVLIEKKIADETMDYWLVRFIDDDFEADRWIAK